VELSQHQTHNSGKKTPFTCPVKENLYEGTPEGSNVTVVGIVLPPEVKEEVSVTPPVEMAFP